MDSVTHVGDEQPALASVEQPKKVASTLVVNLSLRLDQAKVVLVGRPWWDGERERRLLVDDPNLEEARGRGRSRLVGREEGLLDTHREVW